MLTIYYFNFLVKNKKAQIDILNNLNFCKQVLLYNFSPCMNFRQNTANLMEHNYIVNIIKLL